MRTTNNLKLIEDITIDDLAAHRWCYYHNDEEDCDTFEYVISEDHPDFSDDIAELEYAEFKFSNSKTAYGLYDGAESFDIVTSTQWYSMWYGVAKPEHEDVQRLSLFLSNNGYKLPVVARAKWSGTEKTYNGIQYLNENGELCEAVI